MLTEFSITELCDSLNRRQFSAEELAKELIIKIEENEHLGAVAAFEPDSYFNDARNSDKRRQTNQCGFLDGIPLILKDNINTNNLPTTGGTGSLSEKTPPEDAPVTSVLKDAGAIIAAKAVMHELAFGITSNNAVTGPARNPYDRTKIPGGSSGGTATAVSSRQFPAGLGTDTGGSVRIPSALCGIFGFRPTVGRYPGEGVIPISKTRDTVGPMARNMKDIALLDAIMAGKSPSNVTLLDLKSVKIGMPQTRFWENLEPEVERCGRDLLESLEEHGVTIVDADFPDIWELNDNVGFPVALFEVMRELPLYLERAGYGISLKELIDGIGSPDVKGIITSQQGDNAIPEAAYTAAMEQHRPRMQKIYADYFAEHGLDAIIFPTTPLTARPIGQDETVELNGNQEPTFPTFIRNTDLGSNIGAPGISLPVGLGNGLPVGIEIEGLPGEDERLLSLSATIEKFLKPLPAPNISVFQKDT